MAISDMVGVAPKAAQSLLNAKLPPLVNGASISFPFNPRWKSVAQLITSNEPKDHRTTTRRAIISESQHKVVQNRMGTPFVCLSCFERLELLNFERSPRVVLRYNLYTVVHCTLYNCTVQMKKDYIVRVQCNPSCQKDRLLGYLDIV